MPTPGVKTPIALAPMGGIVRAEMVVEITKAGGFGFLGTGMCFTLYTSVGMTLIDTSSQRFTATDC